MRRSQNILPFHHVCDPPRNYSSFPEYTTGSIPLRGVVPEYTPFSTTILQYTLLESPSQNIPQRRVQRMPLHEITVDNFTIYSMRPILGAPPKYHVPPIQIYLLCQTYKCIAPSSPSPPLITTICDASTIISTSPFQNISPIPTNYVYLKGETTNENLPSHSPFTSIVPAGHITSGKIKKSSVFMKIS